MLDEQAVVLEILGDGANLVPDLETPLHVRRDDPEVLPQQLGVSLLVFNRTLLFRLIYDEAEGRLYEQAKRGVSENGRGWWPDSTYWNSDPRTRPTSEQLVIAFTAMQSQWIKIAGEELARHARPIAITGKKKRRLLVAVDADYSPKWGSWTSFEADPAAFRDFRSAVNTVIKPVEVDHIDFVVRGAPGGTYGGIRTDVCT